MDDEVMPSCFSLPDLNSLMNFNMTISDIDAMSMGGYSIMTNLYRSPSYGDLSSAPFILGAVREK